MSTEAYGWYDDRDGPFRDRTPGVDGRANQYASGPGTLTTEDRARVAALDLNPPIPAEDERLSAYYQVLIDANNRFPELWRRRLIHGSGDS